MALAAWLALGLGGASAYPDQRCADHIPPGFGSGSWTQGAGHWPPGLECHFLSSSGEASTYREGFDIVWVAVAITAVFASTLTLAFVWHREGIVHLPS